LFHRSEPEAQIIAYKTQQYKLLPGLAMAYATKFTFDHVWRSFQEMQRQVAAGELSLLPEVSPCKSFELRFFLRISYKHVTSLWRPS